MIGVLFEMEELSLVVNPACNQAKVLVLIKSVS